VVSQLNLIHALSGHLAVPSPDVVMLPPPPGGGLILSSPAETIRQGTDPPNPHEL
jgi:hypothetical protein